MLQGGKSVGFSVSRRWIADGEFTVRVIIHRDAEAATRAVSAFFAEQLAAKPASVLGLATGGTMEGVYAELITLHRAGKMSFARARSFNLDEYLGLPADHPQTYRHYMDERLFRHVDFPPNATHLPDGTSADPEKAAEDYEALIARYGPIDLQLLGLGANGHIGFNEPSSSLGSRTRIKTLTHATIEANGRFFEDGEWQPHQALTVGIATILDARSVLVLALGAGKAEAVAQVVEGPISARWPGTALQMHRHATLVLDEAAASDLTMRDYYQWVQANDG